MGWGSTRLPTHFGLLLVKKRHLMKKALKCWLEEQIRWCDERVHVANWLTKTNQHGGTAKSPQHEGEKPERSREVKFNPIRRCGVWRTCWFSSLWVWASCTAVHCVPWKARHLLYDVLSTDTFALFSFLFAITLIAFTYDFCRLFPAQKDSYLRVQSDRRHIWLFQSSSFMTSSWLQPHWFSKETNRKERRARG